jgi:hypothetical protein
MMPALESSGLPTTAKPPSRQRPIDLLQNALRPRRHHRRASRTLEQQGQKAKLRTTAIDLDATWVSPAGHHQTAAFLVQDRRTYSGRTPPARVRRLRELDCRGDNQFTSVPLRGGNYREVLDRSVRKRAPLSDSAHVGVRPDGHQGGRPSIATTAPINRTRLALRGRRSRTRLARRCRAGWSCSRCGVIGDRIAAARERQSCDSPNIITFIAAWANAFDSPGTHAPTPPAST